MLVRSLLVVLLLGQVYSAPIDTTLPPLSSSPPSSEPPTEEVKFKSQESVTTSAPQETSSKVEEPVSTEEAKPVALFGGQIQVVSYQDSQDSEKGVVSTDAPAKVQEVTSSPPEARKIEEAQPDQEITSFDGKPRTEEEQVVATKIDSSAVKDTEVKEEPAPTYVANEDVAPSVVVAEDEPKAEEKAPAQPEEVISPEIPQETSPPAPEAPASVAVVLNAPEEVYGEKNQDAIIPEAGKEESIPIEIQPEIPLVKSINTLPIGEPQPEQPEQIVPAILEPAVRSIDQIVPEQDVIRPADIVPEQEVPRQPEVPEVPEVPDVVIVVPEQDIPTPPEVQDVPFIVVDDRPEPSESSEENSKESNPAARSLIDTRIDDEISNEEEIRLIPSEEISRREDLDSVLEEVVPVKRVDDSVVIIENIPEIIASSEEQDDISGPENII